MESRVRHWGLSKLSRRSQRKCFVKEMAEYAELSRILPREGESNYDNRLECGNGSWFYVPRDKGRDRAGSVATQTLLLAFNIAMWGRG